MIDIRFLLRWAGEPPLLYGLRVICEGTVSFPQPYNRCLLQLLTELPRDPEEPERAVELKITNNDSNEYAAQERKTEEHIAEANPNNPAHTLLRTSSECFEITGPEGKHLCMAYEPLRDPLWIYEDRFKSGTIPLRLVKVYLYIILEALDYLHTECKLVHTGMYSPSKLPTIPHLSHDILCRSKF